MKINYLSYKEAKDKYYRRPTWDDKQLTVFLTRKGEWQFHKIKDTGSNFMQLFNSNLDYDDYYECDAYGKKISKVSTKVHELHDPRGSKDQWYILAKDSKNIVGFYLMHDGTVKEWEGKEDNPNLYHKTEQLAKEAKDAYEAKHNPKSLITFSDKDTGKVFAKVKWRVSDNSKNGTMFSWNPILQKYGYCTVKNGLITFKKPSHQKNIDAGHTMSLVGDLVLAAELRQVKFDGYETLMLNADVLKEKEAQSICDLKTLSGIDSDTIRNGTYPFTGIGDLHIGDICGGSNFEAKKQSFDDMMDSMKYAIDQITQLSGVDFGCGKDDSHISTGSITAYRSATEMALEQFKLYKQKGNIMKETTKKTIVEELVEALTVKEVEEAPKTDFEARAKIVSHVYNAEGRLIEVNYYTTKKDAKAYLQQPSNLGKTIVLSEEVSVFTTDIPVKEVK